VVLLFIIEQAGPRFHMEVWMGVLIVYWVLLGTILHIAVFPKLFADGLTVVRIS
jgi:hypothetical protein